MTRKGAIAVILAAATLLGGTACSYVHPEASEIGLYYNEGDWDGSVFDHCVTGGSSEAEWNDNIYRLPNSLRTWNLASVGGDSDKPLILAAAPQEGQPSGVRVAVATTTNFSLNTYCGSDEKDKNSPLVKWWEHVGRRYYDQDTTVEKTEWWKNMLLATLVPVLESASQSVFRQYNADDLIAGKNWAEIQDKVSPLISTEVNRLMGGDYFCGPDFDRVHVPITCSQVKLVIKDVDLANPDIQKARDEKQAAIEKATALVAEAQGKLDAANKQAALYNNPNWVAIELAKIELEKAKAQAEACKASPNCTVVTGGAGGIIIGGK